MIKSIFEFSEFRPFLQHWIESRPRKGWGEGQKIAAATGLSSTMVSQVLKGEKPLGTDQAANLGEYIGLGEKEMDYFLVLVEFDRAASEKLRKIYRKRIHSA